MYFYKKYKKKNEKKKQSLLWFNIFILAPNSFLLLYVLRHVVEDTIENLVCDAFHSSPIDDKLENIFKNSIFKYLSDLDFNHQNNYYTEKY